MSKLPIALLFVATTLRAADAPMELVPRDAPRPGKVIVELQPFAKLEQLRADLASIDTRAGKRALPSLRREYHQVLHGAALDLPNAEAVEALRRLPYVRGVYPDLMVKATVECGDGSRRCSERQVALPRSTATIDAATRVNATSLGTRGEGIRVGIIDTGIDYTQAALGGGFGDGYKVAGGWDFVDNDGAPEDQHGHGTHVAGIIAADSVELAGVAPGATLIVYRVLNGMGFGSQSDIIAAIDRSVDPNGDGDPSDHLDVINLSLGSIGTADDLPSRAVDRAVAAGVVVVVAAGNEGEFASVRSPGTARNAITVGAIMDSGAVTDFTSRGPSPGSLELKPDVVAPGYAIVSARVGGGLIAMSGTSMSAPHVTGVAALLRKLHPGWTPADVKSALITSAAPLSAPVFERAAGRVDAAAASARTTFLQGGGVSFGLASSKTGTSTATRAITLTNRGASAQTFDVVPVGMPEGVTIVANPAHLELAPGASQQVQLQFESANTTLAFPLDHAYGGAIELRGAETLKVPWMFVRAGRITVQVEPFGMNLRGISTQRKVAALMYDLDRGEIFDRPGTMWDLLMTSYDTDSDGRPLAAQVLVAEDREMTGDDVVMLHKTDASAQLRFDARDAFGAKLFRAEGEGSSYLTFLAIDYTKGEQQIELGYVTYGDVALFVTPLSPSFAMSPIEWSFDMHRKEAYVVQHPVLHGIAESQTLTANRGDYIHARLRFNDKAIPDSLFTGAFSFGIQESGPMDMHNMIAPAYFISEPLNLDYYTTSESGTVASGTTFATEDMVLPSLRGIDGGIVSTEFNASPVAYRMHDGDFVTVGGQALFPLAFFGTNGGSPPPFLFLRTGLTGALGDWQWGTSVGMPWTFKTANGVLIASGTVDFLQSGGPLPVPGAIFTAVHEGLKIAGQPSRAELEVRYGTSGLDYRAPSLSSFRVVSSSGRIGDAMRLQDAIALEFSAADWSFGDNTATLPLKREATRVWYRANGASEWIAAQAVLTGSDEGNTLALGRIPEGDLYRADLSEAAKVAGAVDLRVEIEDAEGNHSTWTQSPAFVVSSAKGRPVRLSQ